MRVPQLKENPKGSQKWIQKNINVCPGLLNKLIQRELESLSGREICWTSPLEQDEFAEYRDTVFLKNMNLQVLDKELIKFWPKKGPQWDALGRTSDGNAFILVEAKANVPELVSFCGAKDKKSLKIISDSLAETQRWLNCREPHIDWKYGFYQYANRLAHLYFLREKAQKEAYLVFLYFVEDSTHIPTSEETWKSALKLQKKLMGLSNSTLSGKVIELFINTNEINLF
ncbi:MAG: hypothetical protein ACOZF2_18085 [Thermodesulfobacteriota bacterium]